MMEDRLKEHKAEMERVKREMQHCGSTHRNDLYKYYQRLKREYLECKNYIEERKNYDSTSKRR